MTPAACQPTPLRFEEALLRALEINALMLFAGVLILAFTPEEQPTRRKRRHAPKRP